jgi:hypothetical protein
MAPNSMLTIQQLEKVQLGFEMVQKLEHVEQEYGQELMECIIDDKGLMKRPELVSQRQQRLKTETERELRERMREREKESMRRKMEWELESELMERLEREQAKTRLKLRGSETDSEGLYSMRPLLWRRGRQERQDMELELKREFAVAKTLRTRQMWSVIWSDAKRSVETRRIGRLKANGAQQTEIEEEQSICLKTSLIVERKLSRLKLSKCVYMLWSNSLTVKFIVDNLRYHAAALHDRISSLPSRVLDGIENLKGKMLQGSSNNIHAEPHI